MSKTIDRPALMPADTPDYMAPAWAGCMRWAIGDEGIRAQFEAETGLRYRTPTNALDRLINEATGYTDAYISAFIAWANVNVWGNMGAQEGASADV